MRSFNIRASGFRIWAWGSKQVATVSPNRYPGLEGFRVLLLDFNDPGRKSVAPLTKSLQSRA